MNLQTALLLIVAADNRHLHVHHFPYISPTSISSLACPHKSLTSRTQNSPFMIHSNSISPDKSPENAHRSSRSPCVLRRDATQHRVTRSSSSSMPWGSTCVVCSEQVLLLWWGGHGGQAPKRSQPKWPPRHQLNSETLFRVLRTGVIWVNNGRNFFFCT